MSLLVEAVALILEPGGELEGPADHRCRNVLSVLSVLPVIQAVVWRKSNESYLSLCQMCVSFGFCPKSQ